MDLLPSSLLAGRKVLQFSRDDSVNTARVGEYRVSEYGSRDSLDIQAIAVADASYDWVISHHVVNFVPDDGKALAEMLRVAGPDGAVLITVGGTTDNFETRTFAEPTGPHAAYKIYGSDFASRITEAAPEASVIELVGIDPCTATLDVVFVYSRRVELLREIGRRLADNNVFARLSERSSDRGLASTASSPSSQTARETAAPNSPRPMPVGTALNALPISLMPAELAPVSASWHPLIAELGEWKKLGRRPRFWLRDDDASSANPRLDALWQVCAASEITLACAAIPNGINSSLIDWAAARPWLVMMQHGFDHLNRSNSDDSSEFPEERDVDDAVHSIKLGQDRMISFKSRRLQVFVPPWGRLADKVAARLPNLGFTGLSASYLRPAPREHGLAIGNTHVLIPRKTRQDWTFDIGTTVAQLVAVLSAMRARGDRDALEPVGINTHHLSVGAIELAALGSLVQVTRHHGCDWLHPADIFGSA